MAGFNIAEYEPVSARIAKFYADNPNGRIATTLIDSDLPAGEWIVKAAVYKNADDAHPWATGLAHETPEGHVNKTSALENCETSSIGRALANAGYAGSDPEKRASREEMSKVQRGGSAPARSSKPSVASSGDGPTDKQRKFFWKLLDEKQIGDMALPDIDALSKGEASKWIDTLVALPDVEKAARGATVAEATAKLGGEVVEEVPLEAYSDEIF